MKNVLSSFLLLCLPFLTIPPKAEALAKAGIVATNAGENQINKGMKKIQQQIVAVKNVLSSFLLLCLPTFLEAQQINFFVDMDTISDDYRMTHFHLATEELYGTSDTIEIFNILPIHKDKPRENAELALRRSRYLFVFSVLPVFGSDDNWTVYDRRPEDRQSLNYADLMKLASQSIHNDKTTYMPERYGILIHKGGKFYQSKISFLQVFYIRDYPNTFNIPKNVIDIDQPLLSVRKMEEVYKIEYKGGDLPIIPDAYPRFYDNDALERFYLSQKFAIGREEGYQFWTFVPWGKVMDDLSWYRGIDRFLYIPAKGIVGGSYDFYFKDPLPKENPQIPRRNITMQKFKENILNEKIMLAEELKD